MDKDKDNSPAIQLLIDVWDGVHKSKGWSWRTLNSCMHSALHLAIKAGLRFEPEDFDYISQHLRWEYWAGAGEEFYGHAISVNNMSAVHSYELHWHRKPFIFHTVEMPNYTTGVNRQDCRLCVGCRFMWNQELVTLTSFNDKDGTIVACSYKQDGKPDRTVEHVYKITHKHLKEERARR